MVLLDKKFVVLDTKVHIKKLPLSQPLKAHAKTLNSLLKNFECRYSVAFKSCIETFDKEVGFNLRCGGADERGLEAAVQPTPPFRLDQLLLDSTLGH